MEYISAEEFLKQDEKVQKVFLDWWKPSTYDLATNMHGEVQLIGEVMNPNNPNRFKLNNVINNNRFIPLLIEGQIRKFIEDKTGCKVTLIQSNSLPVEIWLSSVDVNIKRISSIDKFDVLQAYWKVAIEIAKEDI